MISKTKLNILKILKKNASYGYEIGKKLKITISSIYKHLEFLLEDGYVEIQEIKQKNERRKKLYKLTEKGVKLLDIVS